MIMSCIQSGSIISGSIVLQISEALSSLSCVYVAKLDGKEKGATEPGKTVIIIHFITGDLQWRASSASVGIKVY